MNPNIDSCSKGPLVPGQPLCLWHSATFTWDGRYVVFGDEAGGGTGSECAADDPATRGAFCMIVCRVRLRPSGRSSSRARRRRTTRATRLHRAHHELRPHQRTLRPPDLLVLGRNERDQLDEPGVSAGDRVLRRRASLDGHRRSGQHRSSPDEHVDHVLVQRPHVHDGRWHEPDGRDCERRSARLRGLPPRPAVADAGVELLALQPADAGEPDAVPRDVAR